MLFLHPKGICRFARARSSRASRTQALLPFTNHLKLKLSNQLMMTKQNPNSDLCPCGSGKPFKLCCQPYVEQTSNAPTAEALMRSRYSAFTLLNEEYLRYSWHPDTCPKQIRLNGNTQWLGLKIKNTVAGDVSDDTGEVEFVARNKVNGKASRLHECSRFSRYNNRWVYLNGKTAD